MQRRTLFTTSAMALVVAVASVAPAGAAPGKSATVGFLTRSQVTTEGNADHVVNVLVTLTGTPRRPNRSVAVNWKVDPTWEGQNPPTAGLDFSPSHGTVKFAPGTTTASIAITITGDTAPEPDEHIALRLTGANNGSAVDSAHAFGFIIIHNDDPFPPPTHNITVTATFGCAVDVTWTPAGGGGPIDSYTVTLADPTTSQTFSQTVPSWDSSSARFAISVADPANWTATVTVNGANWPFAPVTLTGLSYRSCTF